MQGTIQKQKEKNGTLYMPMQIRIWSEVIVGDVHSSLEEPPMSSMFVRTGEGSSCKKKDQGNSSMSEALTQALLLFQAHFHLVHPSPQANSWELALQSQF